MRWFDYNSNFSVSIRPSKSQRSHEISIGHVYLPMVVGYTVIKNSLITKQHIHAINYIGSQHFIFSTTQNIMPILIIRLHYDVFTGKQYPARPYVFFNRNRDTHCYLEWLFMQQPSKPFAVCINASVRFCLHRHVLFDNFASIGKKAFLISLYPFSCSHHIAPHRPFEWMWLLWYTRKRKTKSWAHDKTKVIIISLCNAEWRFNLFICILFFSRRVVCMQW